MPLEVPAADPPELSPHQSVCRWLLVRFGLITFLVTLSAYIGWSFWRQPGMLVGTIVSAVLAVSLLFLELEQ